eukprot:scaffold144933_cov217-Phaeocystis_antarctica.AAC.1
MPRAAIFQKESLAICSAANLASACASSSEIMPSPFESMRRICLSCAGVICTPARGWEHSLNAQRSAGAAGGVQEAG